MAGLPYKLINVCWLNIGTGLELEENMERQNCSIQGTQHEQNLGDGDVQGVWMGKRRLAFGNERGHLVGSLNAW